jgi:hypothetical protein
MRLPSEECRGHALRPLICYWGLLHKHGELAKPLFDVEIGESATISTEAKENRKKNPAFDKVWVFSMSAYLRTLKEPTIELELHELAARIERLKEFFIDCERL